MATNAVPKITAAEYLAMAQAAPFWSEFLNGDVFAMSGGPPVHAQLISTMAHALLGALESRPSAPRCRIFDCRRLPQVGNSWLTM